MTKDELTTLIDNENAQIQKLQADAVAAVQQINAQLNNQIGRCEGRIELYKKELEGLEKEG